MVLVLSPAPLADHDHIGPELGFGIHVGDRMEEQVLIIKTAWHGKTLSEDFLPPSSGGPGGSYTEMMDDVSHVLENLEDLFPR